jgi:hypothetical protein
MPGGGKLKEIPFENSNISWPNEAGQQAFVATLDDGATAVYRLDLDGTLTRILRTGDETSLGKITAIAQSHFDANPPDAAFCLAINTRGQVVVPVEIEADPTVLALLTPTKP